MKKLSLLALLMVLSLPLMISAQEEAPKAEIFGGYSFLRVYPGEGIDSITGHGFSLSVAGNITRSFGVVGEFSRYSKSNFLSDIINDPDLNQIDASVITYLFGPRFTVRTGKAEPFFHGLVGAARGSVDDPTVGGAESGSAFAYALGGGLDIKAHDNFAIRIAQLDYLQARVDGEGVNSLRFSAGVVIRLGKR
ncbi:MAG: outer membrane beta-barrel protein [Blastocatellia bacterium]